MTAIKQVNELYNKLEIENLLKVLQNLKMNIKKVCKWN